MAQHHCLVFSVPFDAGPCSCAMTMRELGKDLRRAFGSGLCEVEVSSGGRAKWSTYSELYTITLIHVSTHFKLMMPAPIQYKK